VVMGRETRVNMYALVLGIPQLAVEIDRTLQ
jgi:hypothetical protein